MILIVGAGISGLGVALNLKRDFLIVEKERVVGGLARENYFETYRSGYGGHFFHFLEREAQKKFLQKFCYFNVWQRKSRVFLNRQLIPYPLQYHLGWLKKGRWQKIINEIREEPPQILLSSLKDFLLYYFGRELSKIFFFPFLEKFWQTELEKIAASADRGTIPLPRRELMLHGTKKRRSNEIGYNVWLHYPQQGMNQLFQQWQQAISTSLALEEELIAIDYLRKRARTSKREIPYEQLVSSIPLKELLLKLQPDKEEFRQWSAKLRHISTLVLNLHLEKRHRYLHWVYLPSRKYPFYRAGYYPFSEPACYLEMSLVPGATFNQKVILAQGLRILQELKLIRSRREVVGWDFQFIPVSYVLFDHDYSAVVEQVRKFLTEHRIYLTGRYGTWNYTSMAEDLERAMNVATELNSL